MTTLRIMTHDIECRYAECHYAKCRYAECHYAKCRYAECIMLNVVMLSVKAPTSLLCCIINCVCKNFYSRDP